MFELDHIAVTCADLGVGVKWLADALGVPLLEGGKHARYGSHNFLLGLADGLYLEVIAPDPAAQVEGSRWFDLDHAPAVPRWGNWICRADDLTAFADIAGPPVPMARGDLRWDITVPKDGSLPLQGGFPTLIKWAKDAAHPATKLPESGCRLLNWTVLHPLAKDLEKLCHLDDPRISFVVNQNAGFVATFMTPHGEVIV